MEADKNRMIDQEFYNEIMGEWALEERKQEAKIEALNERVTITILDIKGFDFTSKFLKDWVESECHGEITFCEEPKGKLQSDTWGASKGVWVEQYCEMEDSYYGNIYFPVGENNWLKCPFAC